MNAQEQTPRLATLLLPWVALLAGCGDEDLPSSEDETSLGTTATGSSTGTGTTSTGTDTGSTTQGETDGPAAPVYIGATRIFDPNGSTGLMFSVPSLAAGTPVDLGQAVEMTDAWVFGPLDQYFYTATIFEPTLQRWELSETGAFIPGPVVSFANEGVGGTYTAAFTPIYAANKSYFVDSVSAQVVVWDPTSMTFLGTIPLPIEAEVTGDLAPTMDITVRDDVVLVSMFWASEESWFTEFGSFVRVVAIDPLTDTVISTQDDPRCESLAPGGTTTDGTTYFSPWDYHATVRAVYGEGFGADSCSLRIVAPGASFDTAYQVDLGALVGGRPAGGLTLINDQEALIHVWHSELVPATPETWVDQRFLPGYKWYRWTLGAPAAVELPNQVPNSEGGEWKRLDGRTVTYAANEEFSETTLHELTATGELAPMLTVPGWTVQLIRLR